MDWSLRIWGLSELFLQDHGPPRIEAYSKQNPCCDAPWKKRRGGWASIRVVRYLYFHDNQGKGITRTICVSFIKIFSMINLLLAWCKSIQILAITLTSMSGPLEQFPLVTSFALTDCNYNIYNVISSYIILLQTQHISLYNSFYLSIYLSIYL